MKKWQWLIVIFLFFFLRLYHLETRLNFSMDQGMEMLRAQELWTNKTLTLLGPSASPVTHGHQFFFGPIIYYLLIIFGLLGNWDPLKASILMTVATFIGMLFLYLTAKKLFTDKVAAITTLLFTFLPITITYSNFLWNPNFLLLFVPAYLYCLVTATEKNIKYWYILAGILGGACLQLHFQTLLLLIITSGWLVIKKVNYKNILVMLFGFVLGYSPLIVFDIRNHFYNLLTIIEWLRFGGGQKFTWQGYYLLALWPLGLLLSSWLLGRIKYELVLLMIASLGILSVFNVTTAQQGFGMPNNWHYYDLVKTAALIPNNQNKYNIVNLLSGDTRFYSLRYLMRNYPPLPVDKYKEAEVLYIISDKDPKETLTNPVWEVQTFGGKIVSNSWQINPNVRLYELRK